MAVNMILERKHLEWLVTTLDKMPKNEIGNTVYHGMVDALSEAILDDVTGTQDIVRNVRIGDKQNGR